ncbi:hypothetical protein HMPREF9004_0840 [Schaalia cardiffensis F0333]|uniref:Uncharacterized protein n=1 Tax=Schaalia cardiffensis F0333 TaxID=888050 RepID=N6X3L6_9ACTO|nr:hypothetical protein HMPREF9004_0840 [Schaalia cardiffensis F0333]
MNCFESRPRPPALSSEPGLALVKGREAEESGAAARASKTQE